MKTKKIFAANWKLNKTPEEAREFVISFKNKVFEKTDFFKNKEIIIFPQAFSLEAVSTLCAGSNIGYGPQNIYSEQSGAFTGENSAEIAKSLKAAYALVGHSERRQIFNEPDDLLNKKMQLLQSLETTPVFCIGENLNQREAGKTLDVCFSQLEKGLGGQTSGQTSGQTNDLASGLNKTKRFIIAYEPVWAIGTGKVATLEQVSEVHQHLQSYLVAQGLLNFQLLYGGSVKPENSAELLNIPFVDGFLIGGAALKVDSFIQICGE